MLQTPLLLSAGLSAQVIKFSPRSDPYGWAVTASWNIFRLDPKKCINLKKKKKNLNPLASLKSLTNYNFSASH